jgi:hypothetical protein
MAQLSKYPDEVKFFSVDFTQPLSNQGNDTISGNPTVTATTPAGAVALTITGQTFVGTLAKFRLGGGTAGASYPIYVLIPTAGGNTLGFLDRLFITPVPN